MAEELKACPFCGGEAKITELRYCNTDKLYGWAIECLGCALVRKREVTWWTLGEKEQEFDQAYAEVLSWWNTRPGDSDKAARLKEIAHLVYMLRFATEPDSVADHISSELNTLANELDQKGEE